MEMNIISKYFLIDSIQMVTNYFKLNIVKSLKFKILRERK